MKFDTAFLRSKVARRIFVLFVCCALLPITALAILSFTHVTKEFNEQNQRRLHQETKAVGMAIFERLTFLEMEMRIAASNLSRGLNSAIEPSVIGIGERLEQRFKTIAFFSEANRYMPLLGHVVVHRSGHTFNHAFLQKVFSQKKSWETRRFDRFESLHSFQPKSLAI